MPTYSNNQGPTLFEQIQQMQDRMADRFQAFSSEEMDNLQAYSTASQSGKFHQKYAEDMNLPGNAQINAAAKRLGALAAHYPKHSDQLAVLREHVPNIDLLRKEKMNALRTDASRTGMDKLLNDFFGSKRRAAKEELERINEARQRIDGRDRSTAVKAPEHAGRGRNILTAITNYSGLGPHKERHENINDFKGTSISFRSKSGVLDGVYMPIGQPNGKVVIIFGGSREPAEDVVEDFADEYLDEGTAVVMFNYRGFGNSKTLDSNNKRIGTPLSEQSLYEDGMEMYKYVKDILGYKPENIILHGYSLGGAVASHVAANVAEKNRLMEEKQIPVPASNKLGGIVLQSPIKSMYAAAKDDMGCCVAGYFGRRGSGEYHTQNNMRRLFQNDPQIPVVYISGKKDDKDHLSLEVTGLHEDPMAQFPNSSCSMTEASHLDRKTMLENTDQHKILGSQGRNAQLDTASIERFNDPIILDQPNIGPAGI